MNPSPSVAIVILNWNGQSFLQQFLPSVLATQYPNFSVVVADNASTDNSITFLQQSFPQVNIIVLEKNYGFAEGYNRALQQVNADYYVLLNSDVEVTPNWLSPMVQLLEGDKNIAACQPKILSWHNKNKFEYAGAAGGWLDKYGYPFSRGRVFDVCEEDKQQYDNIAAVFWATGASLFIRSQAFHECKGFDNYFFAHQEEIDLCWRLQLAGHTIYVCPQSTVYHVGGGTLPKGNSLKTYLNFRNNRIMLSKNLPLSKKLWVMPIRLLLDGVSGFKALLSGDAGFFAAIVKAQFGFLNWLFFHQKKSVFAANKKNKLTGLLPQNIAWLYFVKEKKKFSEIVKKES